MPTHTIAKVMSKLLRKDVELSVQLRYSHGNAGQTVDIALLYPIFSFFTTIFHYSQDVQ